jgi:hypothetical protein
MTLAAASDPSVGTGIAETGGSVGTVGRDAVSAGSGVLGMAPIGVVAWFTAPRICPSAASNAFRLGSPAAGIGDGTAVVWA